VVPDTKPPAPPPPPINAPPPPPPPTTKKLAAVNDVAVKNPLAANICTLLVPRNNPLVVSYLVPPVEVESVTGDGKFILTLYMYLLM
jgi:hypothetical protein